MSDENDDYISRSKQRREARADLNLRKKLLESVVALPPELTAELDIERSLGEDLEQLRRMRNSSARQRLLRRLARRTEDEDWVVLEQVVSQASKVDEREKRKEKKIVAWRDRLLKEGDAALDPACVRFPSADRQQLRQLILRARRNPDSPDSKGSARKLLRVLRQLDGSEEEEV